MAEGILSLIGRRLLVQISDPWEFGTDVGTHPILVIVERVRASQTASRAGVARTEELVVRVEKPFGYRNRKCEYFLASPRHEGGTFATLCDGDDVPTNFVRMVDLDETGDANIGLAGSIREQRTNAPTS